jgi:hypothetical protein
VHLHDENADKPGAGPALRAGGLPRRLATGGISLLLPVGADLGTIQPDRKPQALGSERRECLEMPIHGGVWKMANIQRLIVTAEVLRWAGAKMIELVPPTSLKVHPNHS